MSGLGFCTAEYQNKVNSLRNKQNKDKKNHNPPDIEDGSKLTSKTYNIAIGSELSTIEAAMEARLPASVKRKEVRNYLMARTHIKM